MSDGVPRASLREVHRGQTHERIFLALGDFIVSDGLENLSVPALARRAGVGVATLYRHFPSTDALLAGFFKWLDPQGLGERPEGPDDLLELLPRLYAWFDENEAVIRAGIITGIGREYRAAQRRSRWENEWPIDNLTRGLGREDAVRVGAAIRLLVNSQAWLTLRDEAGLDGERAGRVAAWILGLVLAQVRRR